MESGVNSEIETLRYRKKESVTYCVNVMRYPTPPPPPPPPTPQPTPTHNWAVDGDYMRVVWGG